MSKGNPKKQSNKSNSVTLRVNLTSDEVERLRYWAAAHEVSVAEYAADAIATAIRHENHDYDLPTAEVTRLNQLTEAIASLQSSFEQREQAILLALDSLVNLARGDNNYLDDRVRDNI